MRTPHFDVLRGIAIFLVLVGHIFVFPLEQYGSLWTNLLSSFHMPIFILLAGYFSARSFSKGGGGGIPIICERFKRLILPLAVFPIIYIWLEGGCTFSSLSFEPFLWGNYWFPCFLFGVSVLFYFVARLARCFSSPRYELAVYLFSIPAVLIVNRYSGIYFPQYSMYWESYYLNWLYPFFVWGYLMARYPRIEDWMLRSDVVAVMSVLFIFLLGGDITHRLGELSHGRLIGVCGVVVVYYIAKQMSLRVAQGDRLTARAQSVLVYLGQASFPIYLIHYIFLPTFPAEVKSFLESFSYPGGLLWELAISVVGAFCVLLPTLLTIYIVRLNKYLAFVAFGEKLPKG